MVAKTKRARFIGVLSTLATALALFVFAVVPTIKPTHALGQVYTVTNTGDNGGVNPAVGAGTGTLRQAIIDANANATLLNGEPHNIQFNIPGGGVQTITLAAALPAVTRSTIIDGTTQPGSSCGELIPMNADGTIKSSNTAHAINIAITGNWYNTLVLNATATGSQLVGVALGGAMIDHAPNSVIRCSYMGTNADATGNSATIGTQRVLQLDADNVEITNNVFATPPSIGIMASGTTTQPLIGLSIHNNIIGARPDGITALVATTSGQTSALNISNTKGTKIVNNLLSGTTPAGTVGWGTVIGAGTTDLSVKGNYFGTQLDGLHPILNGRSGGICMTGSATSITIGGSTKAESNVFGGVNNSVSGGAVGVMGNGLAITDLKILGNKIGVGVDGSTEIPNSVAGIAVNSAMSIQIGGTQSGEENIITKSTDGIRLGGILAGGVATVQNNMIYGNSGTGIVLNTSSGVNKVIGNIIGLKGDGTTVAPNNTGIRVGATLAQFYIGGSQSTDRNIISGNTQNGIIVGAEPASMSYVKGNYIGVDKNGAKAGNGSNGIAFNVGNVTVGGGGVGDGNVISGNVQAIASESASTKPRIIQGNIIGLGPDGETSVPNGTSAGPFIIDLRGTSPLTIGGSNLGEGNIISGNLVTGGWGSLTLLQTKDVTVRGNKIGLTKSGAVIGNNQKAGIATIWGGTNITIGGPSASDGNVVAGSAGDGISVDASDTVVENNEVYKNSGSGFSNTGTGIRVVGGVSRISIRHNTVYENVIGIGNNAEWGSATGVLIRQNSVYSNSSIGIDLSTGWGTYDGPTANDPLDPDTGPNNLQNYPVITSSMTKCDGTTDTKNVPMFNSTPNTTFTIDYYANPSWDPNSGKPRQGEQWVSSETVTTDASGNADLTIPSNITYPSVTATAPDGSTSEFGSINTMSFTDCQDMLQRQMVTTTKDFNIDARWTGSSVPYTYYRNYPNWNGTDYVDDIQKSGLTVSVTVGGQPFISTEPLEQWQTAYWLDNNYWSATGHTATPLPEGTYDVVLTVTDESTGLSMTKTYKDAVKVVLPKVTYTTTFTNNATPTLNGTASGVAGLYSAYILPAGTPAPNPSLNQGDPGYQLQRAIFYTPDKDANGNYLDTGSYRVVTSKTEYLTLYTDQVTALAIAGRTSFEQNAAQWWFSDILGSATATTNTIAALRATCTDTVMQQRIVDYFGVSTADQATCEGWFQSQYDSYLANAQTQIQDQTTLVNSSSSPYDFTPLTQGKYDVYILGQDISWTSFTKSFPNGLIVDFTTPTATLVTTSAKDTVSPQLNGSVSDPTATVVVTLTGKDKDGKAVTFGPYTAHNNGDGTWTLPAGTIQPGLILGTYDVKVTVTSLAGNTSTETKTLTITATPPQPTGELSKTGMDGYLMAASGVVIMLAAMIILAVKRFYKKGVHFVRH